MRSYTDPNELDGHQRKLHRAQERARRAEREQRAEEEVRDERGRSWGPRRVKQLAKRQRKG